MRVKLKYDCRVSGTLYKAGTDLEYVSASDARIKDGWPDVKENHYAKIVAVVFPGMPHPTLCHIDQVIIEKNT